MTKFFKLSFTFLLCIVTESECTFRSIQFPPWCPSYLHDCPKNSVPDKQNVLRKCLLTNYSINHIPPATQLINSMKFRYMLSVRDLLLVQKDSVTINILVSLFWNDECLSWNATEFNISYLEFSSREIFTPNFCIFPKSSSNCILSNFEDVAVIVSSNGDVEVTYLPKQIQIPCNEANNPINYFPNDYKSCRMDIELRMMENFSISKLYPKAQSCKIELIDIKQWYIRCSEHNESVYVYKQNLNWPMSSNQSNYDVFRGVIRNDFIVRRYPFDVYSTLIIPGLVIFIFNEIMLLVCPNSPGSYFLQIAFLFTAYWNLIHDYRTFTLLSLCLNIIYAFCISNPIISIFIHNILACEVECASYLRRHQAKIVWLNKIPLKSILIIMLPMYIPLLLGLQGIPPIYSLSVGISFTVLAIYVPMGIIFYCNSNPEQDQGIHQREVRPNEGSNAASDSRGRQGVQQQPGSSNVSINASVDREDHQNIIDDDEDTRTLIRRASNGDQPRIAIKRWNAMLSLSFNQLFILLQIFINLTTYVLLWRIYYEYYKIPS